MIRFFTGTIMWKPAQTSNRNRLSLVIRRSARIARCSACAQLASCNSPSKSDPNVHSSCAPSPIEAQDLEADHDRRVRHIPRNPGG